MRARHVGRPLAAAALAAILGLGASLPAVAHDRLAAAKDTAPVVAPASAPLPACRYADVKTRFRSLSKWRITLVDTDLRVLRKYVPPDLVSVVDAGIGGSGKIRSIVVSDLHAMSKAAKRAGNSIAVRSSYRSFPEQAAVFQMWVDRVGYDQALISSARPGHSEHQLGTTIDFRSGDSTKAPWDYPDWAKTPAGAWMAANAWKYGFLMSYPKGQTDLSCYEYEPWHYRYYGRDLAARIHQSGLVPRVYLWQHFESQP